MGKHAFLIASFQCLARSLLVLEPTEYKIHPTMLQLSGGLHVCVLHSLIIQQRLPQSTEGVSFLVGHPVHLRSKYKNIVL